MTNGVGEEKEMKKKKSEQQIDNADERNKINKHCQSYAKTSIPRCNIIYLI